MKKILCCVMLLGLCACDDTKKEEQVIKKAEAERNQVLTDVETRITKEERKQNFQKRMFDVCKNRFDQDRAIHYSISYKNNVCICFAEKIADFVSSSDEQIKRYDSSEFYQIKTQEMYFNECEEKNAKYKFGI